jgi:hypothetical protein
VAYRENARDETLRGRFWYGPFRPTGMGAGALAAFVVIAPIAVGVLTLEETLTCDRANGVCQFERSDLLQDVRRARFPIADVVDVRYVQGSGKGKNNAESVLVMRSGRDLRLASLPMDEAMARQTRLEEFFEKGAETRVAERWATGPAAKLMLLALALFAAVAAIVGIKKSLPLRVELVGDSLRVGRKRDIDVSSATRVRVDRDPPPKELAKVVIETTRAEHALLSEGRGGIRAHQNTARKLAKLLSIEADVGPEAAPWIRLPKKVPRSFYWVVGGTLALSAIGGLITVVASRTQGTIEIDCIGRCRFDNMECLPGGKVSMSVPPGNFVIETWAPDEPTHWKKHTVPIQVGVKQTFVCPLNP